MLKRLKPILLLCITVLLLGCDKKSVTPSEGLPRELSSMEKSLVGADNQFGFKLFNQIIQAENQKNVFISPLSVSMALGMTWNGAAGETREAMGATLELEGLTVEGVNESYKSLIELLTGLDSKVEFKIANSIWYRFDLAFEQEFIDLNKSYFNALVSGLDFRLPNASNTINAWVDENTSGKIKKIVDDTIDPLTVMFLINAIYFKGTWTYQFDEKLTQVDSFTVVDGSKKPCNMMRQSGMFRYFSNASFQAIDLPYGDKKFGMTVFLPNPGVDIDSLISEFNRENWSLWMNSFSRQEGDLWFPKFGLEYELVLNAVLKALGMEIAFSDGADFTKMYEPGGIFISKVKHKSFVKVDEEGTEAAAATSVEMRLTSVQSGFTMRVDRPFLFIIGENHSQSILFMGKIVDPGLQ